MIIHSGIYLHTNYIDKFFIFSLDTITNNLYIEISKYQIHFGYPNTLHFEFKNNRKILFKTYGYIDEFKVVFPLLYKLYQLSLIISNPSYRYFTTHCVWKNIRISQFKTIIPYRFNKYSFNYKLPFITEASIIKNKFLSHLYYDNICKCILYDVMKNIQLIKDDSVILLDDLIIEQKNAYSVLILNNDYNIPFDVLSQIFMFL